MQLLAFVLLLTAGMGFILSSDLLLARGMNIQKGQAASEDIAAPRRIEFESEIQTESERLRALAEVRPVYEPLDRQVGREQVYRSQQILSFIDSVRVDPYASFSYQRFCLTSIEDVDLTPEVVSDTLQLDESEWKAVQQDTREVLAKVMSEEIRTGEEDLHRRSVRALISFDLSEPQTAIVEAVAGALVEANVVYNEQATEAAREAALAGVKPRIRVLEENEIIVRSGEIVTAEHIEALDALGLRNVRIDWLKVGGVFLFVLLLAVSSAVYLWHNEMALISRAHHLLLVLLLLLLFGFLAKWGLSQTVAQPYLMPLATLGMLIAVLFNVRLALVVHVLLCLVVGYMTEGQLEPFLYTLAGGLIGIFALQRAHRINSFVLAGLYVMLANMALIALFALRNEDLETLQLGQALLVGMVNGALSAIVALGGYYLLGIVFNITTALQLMDLARPTHPLMRELLLKAPGTYHHSIMVGNMAEQAAEAVGADALLTRVGAFYHDIGKTMRPYFFTENQLEGSNPHDLLDPATSCEIIRSHTRDGLDLARKYRLPRAIQAFIAEHHGTAKIGYFYHKAVQEYGQERVLSTDYVHAGPRPQSKETAIVMMADSCEAAVTSVRPHDVEALQQLIRKIVSDKVSSGQLDNAPLTLREIDIIASSFVDTLQGVFHTRIRYPPSGEQAEAPSLQPPLESRLPALTGEGEREESVEQPTPAAVEEGINDDSSADPPSV